MTEKIRAWVNGGGLWRDLLLYALCQTPALFLLYLWRDTFFGL